MDSMENEEMFEPTATKTGGVLSERAADDLNETPKMNRDDDKEKAASETDTCCSCCGHESPSLSPVGVSVGR